jgi:hypothetical protein
MSIETSQSGGFMSIPTTAELPFNPPWVSMTDPGLVVASTSHWGWQQLCCWRRTLGHHN